VFWLRSGYSLATPIEFVALKRSDTVAASIRLPNEDAVKYDDASWHYGGEFPEDLPTSAGAIHIANFVAWASLNGLGGAELEDMEALQARTVTPTDWFVRLCDEKFIDKDLSSEGNSFAVAYYQDPGLNGYLADYDTTFSQHGGAYRASPGWDSYDAIAPVISSRFAEWRERTNKVEGTPVTPSPLGERPKARPFWKFW
jgi:hypothetical protein